MVLLLNTFPVLNAFPIPMETSQALTESVVSLFWISVVVALSPILNRASRGMLPDAVILLVLGCLIGPNGLHLATVTPGVDLVREIGLGLLFLMAGAEIEPETLRSSQGRHAAFTWLLSLLISFGVAMLALPHETVEVAIVLALATTSTALGTLLPILTENGVLGSTLGRAVLTHGAVGEAGPILAMAVLLGTHTGAGTALVLAAFLGICIAAAVLPARLHNRVPHLRTALAETMHGTRQAGMRAIFLLLLTLMAAAAVFGLDIALGAFAAGFVLRSLMPPGAHFIDHRVRVVAWSFLVPVFFVVSGMGISVKAVTAKPFLLLAFVVMILGVRGGTVWLRTRFTPTGEEPTDKHERLQLGLYSAVGLPIIVAVTELATTDDILPDDIAAILVCAGAVTVLLFPLLARRVAGRRGPEAPSGQEPERDLRYDTESGSTVAHPS